MKRAPKTTTVCSACHQTIARGALHFRHDPFPYSRVYRGHKTSHWCKDCILAAALYPKGSITGRLRVPALAVVPQDGVAGRPELEPLRVELISVGRILAAQLATDRHLLHSLTPEQFETFICDRIFAMGFEFTDYMEIKEFCGAARPGLLMR